MTLVCRKLLKGMEAADIADMLEEEENLIQDICNAAKRYAPDYPAESITEDLLLPRTGRAADHKFDERCKRLCEWRASGQY